MEIQSINKEELLNVIENEAKIKVDSIVEGAIELADQGLAGADVRARAVCAAAGEEQSRRHRGGRHAAERAAPACGGDVAGDQETGRSGDEGRVVATHRAGPAKPGAGPGGQTWLGGGRADPA